MPCKKLVLASILFFVLISLPLVGSVGASSTMWTQTYGGTASDSAEAMIQTSDGGYAIAGYTDSFGAGYSDFWLIKTDAYGNVEWNKTYGGESPDHAYALIETPDGGFALAGYITSLAGEYDFWLVKTDEYGNEQWNRTYRGTNCEQAYCLVETSDGGFAIAGDTGQLTFAIVGDADFWLVKTDASGNVEWNQTYGGTESENLRSLVVTSDGGYALAGYTDSSGAEHHNFWLVKTDAYGNMEWNQTYGGAERTVANSIVEASDGGFAIAGNIFDNSREIWLVKTDASGNMEWNQTYGGPTNEYASALVVTSDGGYAIAGVTDSFGAGYSDFWLVKTDAYGNVEWNRTYGGADYEWAHCVLEASDGGFALAGYTWPLPFDAGGFECWLVKTNEYGVIPEFTSWIFLTLFIAVTFVMIMFYRIQRKKLT
jgi:hypothetical protein